VAGSVPHVSRIIDDCGLSCRNAMADGDDADIDASAFITFISDRTDLEGK